MFSSSTKMYHSEKYLLVGLVNELVELGLIIFFLFWFGLVLTRLGIHMQRVIVLLALARWLPSL